MDPEFHDIFKKVREESEKEAKNFRAQFDRFRTALQTQPSLIGNGEIVDWIRKLFDERGCIDSDDSDFSLLINSLAFTSTSISVKEIRLAWATFQDENNDVKPFSYEEYPILEGMARWYFEHCEDSGRVEIEMLARSLAIYDYLIQELLGETSSSYENVLADIGVTVVALFFAIRDYERAKFYVQLLEQEYLAGRMTEEDYVDLMRLYEKILIQEKGESLSTVAKELHRINLLCWDTISDRERQIQALSDESAQLRTDVAKVQAHPDLDDARQKLSKQFGEVWDKLDVRTRHNLELCEAFTHQPLSIQMPEIVPIACFLALKHELLACLFKPRGQLDVEFLRRVKVVNPILLLIKYSESKIPPDERKLFRAALVDAVGDQPFMKHETLRKLKHILRDRHQAEHPEDNPLYTHDNLKDFLNEVWTCGWFMAFLKRFHTGRLREA